LEPALRDLGHGRAVNMPRQDLLVPGPLAYSYHGLKTSCASWPQAGVTTMRVTSDVLTWPMVDGRQRRVKVPLAMGDKYVGLVLLFSIATGELLAIFPDGFMQAIRVGVTNALSAKYLARNDSTTMALYGSGWQALPALSAMCKVLPIEEVRVYSPTKKNRERFVSEMSGKCDVKLFAVSSPEQAARGADIVSLTTNALERCDLMVVSTREAAKLFTLAGEERKVPEFGKGDYGRAELENTAADWRNKPELSEIIAGKVAGRQNDNDVTCMLNHLGLGLQFSASAARILALAQERKLGRELPTEWFCQDEHS